MKKLLLFLSIVTMRQIHGQIITTVAGDGGCCNPFDGVQATATTLYYPNGIAFDLSGNLYISESNSIRKVDASGIITTVAGTGFGGFSGDGGPATSAQINSAGVTVDHVGNIYIVDEQHNRIRKVNTSGIITTIVGTGVGGIGGDGGPATSATISQPYGITVDASGNLYISAGAYIRKVNTSGIINKIAGNYSLGSGYSGDGGPANSAQLNSPVGMAVDLSGNLYIADQLNNCIRKVNTSGIITTVAGNGTYGFSGDGGLATAAKLWNPSAVAVDGAGNLFIDDMQNKVIRMVNASGIINTVAGDTSYGCSGDGGLATSAQLKEAWSIALSSGNLYVGDVQCYLIRKVDNIANSIDQHSSNSLHVQIYPNPTNDKFYIETNATDKLNVDLYDVNGRHVFSASVMDKSNISVATLDNGIYTLTIKTVDRVTNKKLVVVH